MPTIKFSKEESERIKQIFNQFDKNKNNTIEKWLTIVLSIHAINGFNY